MILLWRKCSQNLDHLLKKSGILLPQTKPLKVHIFISIYIYACMYVWKALFCRIKETFLNVAWGQKSLHNFNKWSVGYIDLLSFYLSQLPHKQLWTCQILEAGWNLAGYSKLRLLLTEIFCLGTESNYEFWLWSRFASGRKYFLYKDSNFDTLFSHAFI